MRHESVVCMTSFLKIAVEHSGLTDFIATSAEDYHCDEAPLLLKMLHGNDHLVKTEHYEKQRASSSLSRKYSPIRF